MMDKRVKLSLDAALEGFAKANQYNVKPFNMAISGVFDAEGTFMEKVSALDRVFDDEQKLEQLREVFFDLLMINFFTEDVKKLEEDYLDSEEWEEIEEETIDRGTELLNLLLYLKECDDESIEPSLEDYLNEFLLVDEDEFQDEYQIYEDIIKNQVLVDSSYQEIAEAAALLSPSSEIGELFYPIMSFFLEQNPSEEQIESYIRNSRDTEFDPAVYALLKTYNQK